VKVTVRGNHALRTCRQSHRLDVRVATRQAFFHPVKKRAICIVHLECLSCVMCIYVTWI
jgi:hypothetical protein